VRADERAATIATSGPVRVRMTCFSGRLLYHTADEQYASGGEPQDIRITPEPEPPCIRCS